MTTQTMEPPARMRRQARMMRIVNRPMRVVLGMPFRTPLSGKLMLVTHIGRRTGRTYRQPVSYVRDGDTLLTPGGGRWTRNLRDDEPTELRLAGRRVMALPERVRDRDEVEQLLRRMLVANRRLASFVPFIDSDGTIDPEKLATGVRYGFCIVRWHLLDGRGRA